MKYIYRNQDIVDLPFRVSKADHRYAALSEEQEAYLHEHPDASAADLLRLNASEPEPRPIEEARAEALDTLSRHSLGTIGRHCATYQFANALASLIAIENGGEGIYDRDRSEAFIDTYTRMGRQCRELYYQAKAQIDDSATEQDIETITQQYIELYDHIGNDNQ